MSAASVVRDERSVVVENASYRWAYLVLSYGLLASVVWRGFARGEASWDLLGLVVVGGAVAALYQGSYRVLSRRWVVMTMVAMVSALVLAAAIVLMR